MSSTTAVRRDNQKEWKRNPDMDYHERQFEEVYRGTVHLCDWLESLGRISPDSELRILDIGAGMGSNIHYMAQRFPKCEYVGMDINEDLVVRGSEILAERGMDNCSLVVGDIYDMDEFTGQFDAVVSFQTVLGLPELELPLEQHAELGADWVALSSHFYDGLVNARIEVHDYYRPRDDEEYKVRFYNVHSLQRTEELFAKEGYDQFDWTPFDIDIDLPKTDYKGMGTYTERLEDGRRLQRSGPILMPWHFVCAARAEG
jgi:SAM-dependent methyltransferase